MKPKIGKVGPLVCVESGGIKFVNLCLHDVNIKSSVGDMRIIRIPQSGMVARSKKVATDSVKVGCFRIEREVYDDVYGLPDPEENVYYIVSATILNVLNDSRKDVVGLGKTKTDPGRGKTYVEHLRRQF
jgi:hypothetical protein